MWENSNNTLVITFCASTYGKKFGITYEDVETLLQEFYGPSSSTEKETDTRGD